MEKQTNDRIKDLVDPNTLDENSRAVLVNAIYFKVGTLDRINNNLDVYKYCFKFEWIIDTLSLNREHGNIHSKKVSHVTKTSICRIEKKYRCQQCITKKTTIMEKVQNLTQEYVTYSFLYIFKYTCTFLKFVSVLRPFFSF